MGQLMSAPVAERRARTRTNGELHRAVEVDVLVPASDLERLSGLALQSKFLRLPSSGHAPHVFFVHYDTATGIWLKLDVVTDLRYGWPVGFLRAVSARECLQRRRHQGAYAVMAPEDEVLHLILHAILDKKVFAPRHVRRLNVLRKELFDNSPATARLMANCHRYLLPALDRGALAEGLASGDWTRAIRRRRALIRHLMGQTPLRSVGHFVSAPWRRLRPLLSGRKGRGIAVALLGPDGAGKSTLARELAWLLPFRSRLVYMGYGLHCHRDLAVGWRWLARLAGYVPDSTSRAPRKPLIALRFCARLALQVSRSLVVQTHRALGRLVVLDRHTSEAWLANGDSRPCFRRRLLSAVCPVDLVVLLDAPEAVLLSRKREHPYEVLGTQRLAYRRLVSQMPAGVIVDAAKPRDEVRAATTALIWRFYWSRHSGGRAL
jgi:thymidylate kinase